MGDSRDEDTEARTETRFQPKSVWTLLIFGCGRHDEVVEVRGQDQPPKRPLAGEPGGEKSRLDFLGNPTKSLLCLLFVAETSGVRGVDMSTFLSDSCSWLRAAGGL